MPVVGILLPTFCGKGSYTSVYKMDGSNGSFSKTFASGTGWSDATGYFFSTENYGLSDGGGRSENVSTVRNNLLAGKYTCSAFVDRNTNDIVSGNKYTVASDGTVTVTTGGKTTENVGWIDTTMYNYRTKTRLQTLRLIQLSLTMQSIQPMVRLNPIMMRLFINHTIRL